MDTFLMFLAVLVVMFFVARPHLKRLLTNQTKDRSPAHAGRAECSERDRA